MPSPTAMSVIVRVAAALAAAIVTWIVNILPLDVETIEAGRKALEGALTFIGMCVFMFVYTVVRPWLSKKFHPADDSAGGSVNG